MHYKNSIVSCVFVYSPAKCHPHTYRRNIRHGCGGGPVVCQQGHTLVSGLAVNYLTERRQSRHKVEDSGAGGGAMASLGTRIGRLIVVAIVSRFLSSTISPAAAAQVRMPI